MVIYTPSLISPLGTNIFNFGKVEVYWSIIDPISDDFEITYDKICYELEYTENYQQDKSVWHTISKRIPGNVSEFIWNVGRMIKTDKARIRIRAKQINGINASEYAYSPNDFSINIYSANPPAILSPVSGESYSDYVTIILNEESILNTYNQKVTYKFEYYSENASVDWTTIYEKVPPGTGVLRWNVDDLPAAGDYQLKLTVDDGSGNQHSVIIVDNIKITNPGLFIIDTTPPEAVIEVNGLESYVTNKLDQVINIYAEDESTDVQYMQFRESLANASITLGEAKTTEPSTENDACNFDDKKKSYFTPKTPWTFQDESGQKKLEALLTDYAGNKSCTKNTQVFAPLYKTEVTVNDLITVIESVPKISGTSVTNALYEVLYLGMNDGKLIRISPAPRVVTTFSHPITAIALYNNVIYIAIHNEVEYKSSIYKYVYTQTPILVNSFDIEYSKITSMVQFKSKLYIATQGGKLYSFDGSSFSEIEEFEKPIKQLKSDERYLYIGMFNSDNMYTYNGEEIFEMDLVNV